MTNDLPELPDGWTWCKGKDLFTFVRGVSFKKEDAQSTADSNCVAILRAGNLQNGRVLADDLIYVPSRYVSDLQRLRSGDLIVAMSSGSASVVGKVAVAEIDLPDTSFGTFCGGLRAHIADFRRWLFHFFQTSKYRTFISSEAAGININNLRAEHLLELDIPLPPAPELNRLVAKSEALQSRSRKAREALEAIPPLLEQFRQSVLAAAFRGDLTAEWRDKHTDIEPVSMLLERVNTERRRHWEEYELWKFKAKNKEPKDEKWKDKYREPPRLEYSVLPEIPPTWSLVNWTTLTMWVTYGFTRPMPHVDQGRMIVTAKNIKDDGLDFREIDFTTEEAYRELSPKDRPHPGDILIIKDGATTGRAALVPEAVDDFCISQSVAVVWLRGSPMNRLFLLRWIQSSFIQRQIQIAMAGNAMPHLSITDFDRMPVPIPPLDEQNAICERLEQMLAQVKNLERVYQETSSDLKILDQSILAKAFRGELVPQDPADEPASVLLERIRAATNGESHASTSKKRRRRSET